MEQVALTLPQNDSPAPVLLVEDNLVNQKVVLILLERLGLQAKVANNGKEAVEEMGRDKFSVVLMDCHMPEMDGFEATVAIRKLEALAGRYTPIIAVTALAMAGDRERCIAAGMDDYIPKPVDKELLKIKLNHWLQKEVVYRQHKLNRAHSPLTFVDTKPIDLQELVEFYGEDQMNQIIRVFIDTTQDMLKRIGFFLKEHDAKAVGRLAHELRVSGASVGAKQIAKLSLYLEQAAGQEDWLEAQETLDSIAKSFRYCQEMIFSVTWPAHTSHS